MSGHSKWAKIHRQKAVTDAKKGTVFTKHANIITIAARAGGGDPEMDFKLKLSIEKAKQANMPKDNIDRAIARGIGESDDKKIEEVAYEGFGPGGVAFIIECLTDNRNRTSANIKHIFSLYGGSMGSPNSVLWQFEKKGMIGIKDINEDTELMLIDEGAENIERVGGSFTLTCDVGSLEKFKKILETKKIQVAFADIEYVPKNTADVSDQATKEKIEKFISDIEELEEVNNYYTNANI